MRPQVAQIISHGLQPTRDIECVSESLIDPFDAKLHNALGQHFFKAIPHSDGRMPLPTFVTTMERFQDREASANLLREINF
jgi:hypothetical protein